MDAQDRDAHDRGARRTARGLAWFGIGLGVIEVVVPGRLARAIGLDGHARTLRLFGLREIASGLVVLADPRPERRLGLRVGGDMLDAALFARGLRADNPKRARTLVAAATVAPVVVLDTVCWLRARRASRSAAPDPTRPIRSPSRAG